MASAALAAASLEFYFEDFQFTFNLPNGTTTADVGKAVMIDSSVDMGAKLVTVGAKVLGRLEQVEVRVQDGVTVGTVSLKFVGALPSNGTINRGDSIVGYAAGVVKAATPITATALAGDVPSYNNVALVAAASNVVNVAFGL